MIVYYSFYFTKFETLQFFISKNDTDYSMLSTWYFYTTAWRGGDVWKSSERLEEGT